MNSTVTAILPPEILLTILEHVPLKDVANFAAVSSAFRRAADSYLSSSNALSIYPWLTVPPESTLISLVRYIFDPVTSRKRLAAAEVLADQLRQEMKSDTHIHRHDMTREGDYEIHRFENESFRLPLLKDGFLHIYWPGEVSRTKDGSWVVQIHVKKVQWQGPIPASTLNLNTTNKKVIRGESLLIHTRSGVQIPCSTIFCYETLMQCSTEKEDIVFFVTDLGGPQDRLNELFYGDFQTGKIVKLCQTKSHAIHCPSRRGERRFLLRNKYLWMLACDPGGEMRVSQLDLFKTESWIYTEGRIGMGDFSSPQMETTG
ncbi:hypothetical protein CJU90_0621 [Yarrowia sp. C11]|nr:hypothetical protein CKK34_2033 [Yarrowia sp. E02]KAG5372961.1 hypothetical protein CJU90_0621 [Yarrowia sp. C11]